MTKLQTTVKIECDTWVQFRAQCRMLDTTVSEVIEMLIKKWLIHVESDKRFFDDV